MSGFTRGGEKLTYFQRQNKFNLEVYQEYSKIFVLVGIGKDIKIGNTKINRKGIVTEFIKPPVIALSR